MNEAELRIVIHGLLNNINTYNEELIKILENIKRNMNDVQNTIDEFDNNELANKVLDDISTDMKGTKEEEEMQDNADKISKLLKELNLF